MQYFDKNALLRVLLLFSIAGGLCGCAMQGPVQPSENLSSAYVVVGENGTQVARVLTKDAQCPLIRFDTHEVQMDARAMPASLPLRATRSAASDSKPSVFSLLACEKEIPAGTKRAIVAEHSLPLLAGVVNRIVVIGDTGCRLKKSDNAYQACNDSQSYPFAKVAGEAAKWRPDLVVHVGDFQYRENACPDNNPGCAGSPWGYGGDTWQADFFIPGAALLKAAPWVMVRGNHESCSRAGQGWWRMIDPRPLQPGRDCNQASDDDKGDYSDPYAVPLGEGAQLIVLDTSNTSGELIPPGDIRQSKYRDSYEKLESLSRQAAYNIVANHQPILGFDASQDKQGAVTLHPGNQGLQSVFGAINPLLLPPRVDVLLSGHVHVWQEVSFSSPHPTQFVTGFSGTLEDMVPLPDKLPDGATPSQGAVVEHHSSWVNGFGFMTMERKGAEQWAVNVWDADGKIRNACTIVGRHSVCEKTQVR